MEVEVVAEVVGRVEVEVVMMELVVELVGIVDVEVVQRADGQTVEVVLVVVEVLAEVVGLVEEVVVVEVVDVVGWPNFSVVVVEAVVEEEVVPVAGLVEEHKEVVQAVVGDGVVADVVACEGAGVGVGPLEAPKETDCRGTNIVSANGSKKISGNNTAIKYLVFT